mmetsp:Transcript_43448/g.143784  ORF Transcript_43448/g.143784 Transcript_43448/m.143784 type:complete len:217 (-) Transcript_43448:4065-4715(-)
MKPASRRSSCLRLAEYALCHPMASSASAGRSSASCIRTSSAEVLFSSIACRKVRTSRCRPASPSSRSASRAPAPIAGGAALRLSSRLHISTTLVSSSVAEFLPDTLPCSASMSTRQASSAWRRFEPSRLASSCISSSHTSRVMSTSTTRRGWSQSKSCMPLWCPAQHSARKVSSRSGRARLTNGARISERSSSTVAPASPTVISSKFASASRCVSR